MTRHTKKPIEVYAQCLPESVNITFSTQMKVYLIHAGSKRLASRGETEVLRWENPARVFAYIARREMGIKEREE